MVPGVCIVFFFPPIFPEKTYQGISSSFTYCFPFLSAGY